MKTEIYILDKTGDVAKYDVSQIDEGLSAVIYDGLKDHSVLIGMNEQALSLYYSKGLDLLNRLEPEYTAFEEKLQILFDKYLFLGRMHAYLEDNEMSTAEYNQILPLWESAGDWFSVAVLVSNDNLWEKGTSWDERIPKVWGYFVETRMPISLSPTYLSLWSRDSEEGLMGELEEELN